MSAQAGMAAGRRISANHIDGYRHRPPHMPLQNRIQRLRLAERPAANGYSVMKERQAIEEISLSARTELANLRGHILGLRIA